LYDPTSNSYLTFHFDLARINTAGLWISVCGLTGEDRVALEPCMGVSDSLDRSIALGSARTLPPGDVQVWELVLELGVGLPE
jgi:hypothetical protein